MRIAERPKETILDTSIMHPNAGTAQEIIATSSTSLLELEEVITRGIRTFMVVGNRR